jgi:hypothetical protein
VPADSADGAVERDGQWQHRTHFVANTRWWPPFCMVVDWVVAAIIVAEIAAGMRFG